MLLLILNASHKGGKIMLNSNNVFLLQVIGLLDVFTPATSLEEFNDV